MRIPCSEIIIDAGDIIQRLERFALSDDPDVLTDTEAAALLAMLDAALPDRVEVATLSEETIFLSALFSDGS